MALQALLAAPAIGKALVTGLGGLFGWLGGRSQSKQHQRQLASEERRQRNILRAMQQWQAQDALAQQAFEERRGKAIARAAGIAGIDPEMAALLQETSGGGGGGMMPNFEAAAVPSAGAPRMPAGQFDFMSLLPYIFGPSPDEVPEDRQSVMRSQPQRGAPAGGQRRQRGPTSLPGYRRPSRGTA